MRNLIDLLHVLSAIIIVSVIGAAVGALCGNVCWWLGGHEWAAVDSAAWWARGIGGVVGLAAIWYGADKLLDGITFG